MRKNVPFRMIISLVAVLLSQTTFSQETFNPSTGYLSWDISTEVSLEYTYYCSRRQRGYSSVPEEQSIMKWHEFYKDIDFFNVLGLEKINLLDCSGWNSYLGDLGKPGIRAIYKLTSDRVFPISYRNDISINNVGILLDKGRRSGFGNTEYYRPIYFGNTENYRPIYAALATNEPVTVRIHAQGYPRGETLAEVIIDTSNIQRVEEAQRAWSQVYIDERNDEIQEKYKWVVIYNIMALLVSVAFLFVYFLKAHQFVKRKSLAGYSRVKRKSLAGYSRVKNILNFSSRKRNRVNIKKRDGQESYSVADELLKWVRLKEEGHISEKEFEDARKKILGSD